jgi:hypothetical protein
MGKGEKVASRDDGEFEAILKIQNQIGEKGGLDTDPEESLDREKKDIPI